MFAHLIRSSMLVCFTLLTACAVDSTDASAEPEEAVPQPSRAELAGGASWFEYCDHYAAALCEGRSCCPRADETYPTLESCEANVREECLGFGYSVSSAPDVARATDALARLAERVARCEPTSNRETLRASQLPAQVDEPCNFERQCADGLACGREHEVCINGASEGEDCTDVACAEPLKCVQNVCVSVARPYAADGCRVALDCYRSDIGGVACIDGACVQRVRDTFCGPRL